MNWLVHDFGPNYGDNFRGFLFLKAVKEKFPAVRMTCWVTPDLDRGLGGLRKYLGFLDHFLVRERSPRETYLFNFGVLKGLTQDRKDFVLEHFPGGLGPDGKYYEKIIPNSEPWMTAKWIHRETLLALDSINQGKFLRRMLNLSMEELEQACPLFGQRQKGEGGVGVGLCRPREKDRKQPSRTKIDRIWDSLKKRDGNIFALDYQSWYPIPQTPNVKDWRMRGFSEKVSILNRASLFIGIDGGLNHFAAACGCPTLSFYGEKHGTDWGERVGPYPRKTPFGEHMMFGNFEEFLYAIDRKLAQLSKGGNGSIGPEVGIQSLPLEPLNPRPLEPSISGPLNPRPLVPFSLIAGVKP